MKKTLFLLSFCVFTAGNLPAQLIKNVAVQGGLCSATQTWYYKSLDVYDELSYRIGPSAGVAVEWFDNKHWSMLTEVGYVQKGNVRVIFREDHLKFNYLTFSPLAKFRFQGKRFTPYLFAGPRIDYQLSMYPEHVPVGNEKLPVKTAFGLNYGAGLEYKTRGKLGIAAAFQHHLDLAPILDTEPAENYTGLYIKNKAYVLNLVVKYYFDKE